MAPKYRLYELQSWTVSVATMALSHGLHEPHTGFEIEDDAHATTERLSLGNPLLKRLDLPSSGLLMVVIL